jgi:hypothetical protein
LQFERRAVGAQKRASRKQRERFISSLVALPLVEHTGISAAFVKLNLEKVQMTVSSPHFVGVGLPHALFDLREREGFEKLSEAPHYCVAGRYNVDPLQDYFVVTASKGSHL